MWIILACLVSVQAWPSSPLRLFLSHAPHPLESVTRLFDKMNEFCTRNDIPAFIGEFSVTDKKESASRIRWTSAVANATLSRKMIPVLWDTGHEVSRLSPYAASAELVQVLRSLTHPPVSPMPAAQ